jgi:hypothetical protein
MAAKLQLGQSSPLVQAKQAEQVPVNKYHLLHEQRWHQTRFATDITNAVSESINIPCDCSGGAGTKNFVDVFENHSTTGALAASILHSMNPIPVLKQYLS